MRGEGPIDLSELDGLEASHPDDVEFCAPGRGRAGLDSFRHLERLADAPEELPISVSLEHLHEERTTGAERANGEPPENCKN